MKHQFKKLKTKKEVQYVLYCPKLDKWKIVFLSGFEPEQHFHCDCGDMIGK